MHPVKALASLALMSGLSVQATELVAALVKIPALSSRSVDAILKLDGKHVWMQISDLKQIDGINFELLHTKENSIDLTEIGHAVMDEQLSEMTLEINPSLIKSKKHLMTRNTNFQIPSIDPLDALLISYDIQGQVTGDHKSISGQYDISRPLNFLNGAVADIQLTQIGSRFHRQNALISKDFTNNSTVLLAGDSVSRTGRSSAPVRFTGIQYRRDSGINSSFLVAPSLSFTGVASTASTLEVLIDNKLVSSKTILPGPFDLSGVSSAITGINGEVKVVVTDSKGNQNIQTGTLLSGSSLLAEGISDFALQAGLMRTGESTYSGAMVSGFYRYGFQDFTAELSAETSTRSNTTSPLTHISASIDYPTTFGSFGADISVGEGLSSKARYSWNRTLNSGSINFSASTTKSTEGFHQVGGDGQALPSSEQIFIANYGQGPWQISAATVRRANKSGNSVNENIGMDSVFMSWTSKSGTSFTASANRFSMEGKRSESVFIGLSLPLDGYGVRFSSSKSGNNLTRSLSATYSDPTKTAMVGVDSTDTRARYSASGSYRTNALVDIAASVSHTSYSASGSTIHSLSAGRLNARGSLVIADSGIHMSRNIGNGGYALVETGVADIEVNSGGSFRAMTDSEGRVVVPVRSYTAVQVGFNEQTTPLAFDISPIKVVTGRKTGVLVRPDSVEFGLGAAVMIQLPVAQGVFNVDGHRYPITDRGAWVDDLAPGVYYGRVEGRDGLVEFEVSL